MERLSRRRSRCLHIMARGFRVPSYPVWPSLFSFCSAFCHYLGCSTADIVAGLLAAGLCIGFVCSSYDVGFFACTAESPSCGLWCFRARGCNAPSANSLASLPFWIGTALVVVPLFVAYAATGIIPDFISKSWNTHPRITPRCVLFRSLDLIQQRVSDE